MKHFELQKTEYSDDILALNLQFIHIVGGVSVDVSAKMNKHRQGQEENYSGSVRACVRA